ncbi:5651_t:CDS:2, partial [Funneliformis caledonium]
MATETEPPLTCPSCNVIIELTREEAVLASRKYHLQKKQTDTGQGNEELMTSLRLVEGGSCAGQGGQSKQVTMQDQATSPIMIEDEDDNDNRSNSIDNRRNSSRRRTSPRITREQEKFQTLLQELSTPAKGEKAENVDEEEDADGSNRENETLSDWKDRIWDILMCNVWFRINIGICYFCNQLVYSKLGSEYEYFHAFFMEKHWHTNCIENEYCDMSFEDYIKLKNNPPPCYFTKKAIHRYEMWLKNVSNRIRRISKEISPVALMGGLKRYPMRHSTNAPEILAYRFERSHVLINAEEYFNS